MLQKALIAVIVALLAAVAGLGLTLWVTRAELSVAKSESRRLENDVATLTGARDRLVLALDAQNEAVSKLESLSQDIQKRAEDARLSADRESAVNRSLAAKLDAMRQAPPPVDQCKAMTDALDLYMRERP